MENFYRIFESADANEIGFTPQVYDELVDFDIYDKNSGYHLNFSKANSETLWPVCKLSGKAKKTDLISHSFMSLSNKMFVSLKLYEILSKVKIEGVQFIKSKLIVKKGKEEEYWILNPYLSDYSCLDVSNCEFVYTDIMGKIEYNQVRFETTTSFIKAYLQNQKDAVLVGYPNHRPLVIKKISFKKDDKIYDFFSIAGMIYGVYGFFVSGKVKDEIQNTGCTGIVFKEPNEKYP